MHPAEHCSERPIQTPVQSPAFAHWVFRPGSVRADALATAAGVPATRRFPAAPARRSDAASEAAAFLHPALDHLLDPYTMHGMAAAVARIQPAIAAAQPILIYGDYDVDGTTAIVLLKTAIELLGGTVRYHVPHRLRDGYGMQAEMLTRAAADGVRLVISVDTGIRAFAAAEEAHASTSI